MAELVSFGELLKGFAPVALAQAWRDAVGPMIAKQCEFKGTRPSAQGPVLLIEVRDPLWRQELHMQLPELLVRLRELLATTRIAEHQWPVSIQIFAPQSKFYGRDKLSGEGKPSGQSSKKKYL